MLRTILIAVLMVQVTLCFPQGTSDQKDQKEGPADSTVQYRKEVHITNSGDSRQFFDAIFQIPIATLQAVNGLVNQAAANKPVYTKTIVTTNPQQQDSVEAAPIHYNKKVYVTNSVIEDPKQTTEETSTVKYRKEFRVRNTANGNAYRKGLFDAIFQIPISTLTAVNNLVNQAAGSNGIRKEIRISQVNKSETTRNSAQKEVM
ncbi:unnamed protein product [Hermetia illucens]|uniref:Uncharacterized protein n=1 Tax=Hermetia illucens TaxID=343691 RepID=A0A7R8UAR0_HERIL|nr:uncharacterized protein LOC119646578 [Hermetia illucens]CAD7077335.1 unnamed protein product [Hermetia illucens]